MHLANHISAPDGTMNEIKSLRSMLSQNGW